MVKEGGPEVLGGDAGEVVGEVGGEEGEGVGLALGDEEAAVAGGGGGEEADPREVVEGEGEGAPGGLVAGGVEAGADVKGRELAEGGVADG